MKKFYEYILEEEEKKKMSSDTHGKLHELLVGYHLQGGHMEKHPDKNGHTPEEAHEKLKASVSEDDYNRVNENAQKAAEHIRGLVKEKGGDVHKVHWTSQPGDLHRSTNIHASQDQDSSDIVVTDHNGKHHGVSLKVTGKKSGNVPVSNPGMEYTMGGKEIVDNNREDLHRKHPWINEVSGSARQNGLTPDKARKLHMRSNPQIQKAVRQQNSDTLNKVVEHLHSKLEAMSPEERVAHIRHIIKAKPTPMQEEGHHHIRHTTYNDGSTHHVDPTEAHEHILSDPKNITVRRSGTSIYFDHNGKPFAKHRLKYENADDPLSTIKGSGELVGKH